MTPTTEIILKMNKPNFSLSVNSTQTPLPRAFDVRGFDLCVSDVSMSALRNIPKSTVIVYADDTIYDVVFESKSCPSSIAVLDYIHDKLRHYLDIQLDVHGHMKFTVLPNVSKVFFPYKLAQILGMGTYEIIEDTMGVRPVDPTLFLKRIYIASPIVEPSVVNGFYAPIIYFGPADQIVSTPTYFPLAISQLSHIELKILDSTYDAVDLDFSTLNVMFHFRSP